MPQDYAEAMKWFLLAAEQGVADAQFNLGVMYEDGNGVHEEEVQAENWYRLAAEQGHREAGESLNRLLIDSSDPGG